MTTRNKSTTAHFVTNLIAKSCRLLGSAGLATLLITTAHGQSPSVPAETNALWIVPPASALTTGNQSSISGQLTPAEIAQLTNSGKALATRQAIFVGYTLVSQVVDCRWRPDQGVVPNSIGVPPAQVSMGALGSPGTDGYVYATLPDDTTVDITVRAPPNHYTWTEAVGKFELVITCVAPIPNKQERTTVGVGEEVNMDFQSIDGASLAPENYPAWGNVGGGLNVLPGTRANGVLYTASSNETSDRVMANFVKAGGGVTTLTTKFTVKAPTGYDPRQTRPVSPDCFPLGQAGAGMTIHVVMAPTDVSLYRAQIMEVGGPPSGASGYFLPPPEGNGAPDHGDPHKPVVRSRLRQRVEDRRSCNIWDDSRALDHSKLVRRRLHLEHPS